MQNPGLNTKIVKSKNMLFVGAGASAPLGLKPTAPFLQLLKQRLDKLIPKKEGKSLDHGKTWEPIFDPFFAQAAKHYGSTLADSEVVLDYLDYHVKACQQLHELPRQLAELAGTGAQSNFHFDWAQMLSRVRGYIEEIVVEHYSRVDAKHAFSLYGEIFPTLCGIGEVLPIFTTNYDWAFESLTEASLETQPLNLVDGFKSRPTGECWMREVFDKFVPDIQKVNLALFKLHGSTSWYRDANMQSPIWKFPTPRPELAGSRAVLIYPAQVKSEAVREDPFQTAYEYLQQTLKEASLCLVIGFSFRDMAINDRLRCALTENSNLRIVIVEPHMNESPGLAFDDLLQKLGLKQDDWKQRIRVIKGKFGEDSFVYDKIKEMIQRLDDWAKLESWVPNKP